MRADRPTAQHQSPWWVALLAGVVVAIVGLLPWLVGGGRLPLQNLWAVETLPEAMPFSPLPVSQYQVIQLLALLLIGGALAGLVARFVFFRRGGTVWPAGIGVLVVHTVAIAWSFAVVADGLALGRGGDPRADLYFGGLLGGTIVSALLAQAAFWMIARGSTALAALGVALCAVPFGNWVGTWFMTAIGSGAPPVFLGDLLRWLPAIVTGVALAWCGFRPLTRLIVWAVGLLALWLLPATFATMQYAFGMRVFGGNLATMADAAAQLFPQVVFHETAWQAPAVALAIGIAGAAAMVLVRGRDDEDPDRS